LISNAWNNFAALEDSSVSQARATLPSRDFLSSAVGAGAGAGAGSGSRSGTGIRHTVLPSSLGDSTSTNEIDRFFSECSWGEPGKGVIRDPAPVTGQGLSAIVSPIPLRSSGEPRELTVGRRQPASRLRPPVDRKSSLFSENIGGVRFDLRLLYASFSAYVLGLKEPDLLAKGLKDFIEVNFSKPKGVYKHYNKMDWVRIAHLMKALWYKATREVINKSECRSMLPVVLKYYQMQKEFHETLSADSRLGRDPSVLSLMALMEDCLGISRLQEDHREELDVWAIQSFEKRGIVSAAFFSAVSLQRVEGLYPKI
jgi:hypothetical protein